ncbi:iron transporter [Pasteurellaceae bacterium LFhippo2]|nr:iron transporter [Pasteurellaceae bacterium LFhippo2]
MAIIPLSELEKDVSALIHTIVPSDIFGELDELVGRRLSDLGFSQGMLLTMLSTGPTGKGPYAVRLGNQSQFALREAEANKILCERIA